MHCAKGVSATGVSAPGGLPAPGGVCSWGVSAPGGACLGGAGILAHPRQNS